MKFRTNAKCMGCVSAIRSALSPLAPAEEWEFDLQSTDRTMTFTGAAAPEPAEVIRLVAGAGFKAEQID